MLTRAQTTHDAAMRKQKLRKLPRGSLAAPTTMTSPTSAVFRKGGGAGLIVRAGPKAIKLGGKCDGHEVLNDLNDMTRRRRPPACSASV